MLSKVASITFDTFPAQRDNLGREVKVCFHSDTSKTLKGTIVRADAEDPFVDIIQLENGKYILTTECQYTFP